MEDRRPLALALVLMIVLLVLAFVFVPVRSDMTDLLPRGDTATTRLMLEELRSGGATSLILVGIDGAPEAELAALSRRLADTLADSPGIALVQNGSRLPDWDALEGLFARRYLLSPTTGTDRFTVERLRADFQRLVDALQSAAFPMVTRFGPADPTGAFITMIGAWTGAARIRAVDGVWFSMPDAGPPTAVMLIRTRANGLDVAARDDTVGLLRRSFEQIKGQSGARLLLAGPGVFARDISTGISADVRLISTVSALLVAALLIWRFRSPWVIAAVAIPVLFGVAFATTVTGLRFGFMHGLTLGFGMTMLGVTIDYPVLLVGHRKEGEPEAGTIARIGRTFMLAVLTIALGLSGMLFADVPAVAQLGTFAVAGVLGAAAVTRFLLPPLIVASGLAPVAAGDPRLLHRIERLHRLRPAAVVAVAAALLWLLVIGVPPLQRDLDALTPLPPGARALDGRLRAILGAPEPGILAAVQGQSEEEVLQREEALRPVLDGLVHEGAIGGYEMAANLLPSQALQRARAAALPDAATLAMRVDQARAGLPFTPTAFARFEADVAASRSMAPVTWKDLANPLFAVRLSLLLADRDGISIGFIAPLAVRDQARLATALGTVPDVLVLDVRGAASALAEAYVRTSLRLLAVSAAAAVVCLLLVLRDPWRVLRMSVAVASPVLVTLAVLGAIGIRLTLIHLVSLQFVAGLGFDYALFLSRPQLDDEERARTLRTLATCVTMTLLTFGLLMLCRTPLLRDIGTTVAIGVASAIMFAFLFATPVRLHPGRGA
jgi:predicted exporter